MRSYGEVFSPDTWHVASYTAFLDAYRTELAGLSAIQILDRYFNAYERIHGISQFDLMFNQIEIASPKTWNPFDTYLIYGYLRLRHAVVISLERSHQETFVSRKYLEHSRQPDFEPGEAIGGRSLDEKEYMQFVRYIDRHRRTLYESMDSYDAFVRIQYSDIACSGALPDALCDTIVRTAKRHGISISPAVIQIHSPTLRPTGIDYSTVFENLDALTSIGGD